MSYDFDLHSLIQPSYLYQRESLQQTLAPNGTYKIILSYLQTPFENHKPHIQAEHLSTYPPLQPTTLNFFQHPTTPHHASPPPPHHLTLPPPLRLLHTHHKHHNLFILRPNPLKNQTRPSRPLRRRLPNSHNRFPPSRIRTRFSSRKYPYYPQP